MNTEEIGTQVKALEDQVKTMGNQIKALQTLLDIEEIMKLQRSYGFYLEHWMFQEIVDCFSDSPDVTFDLYPIGTWKGKEGVIRYFEQHKEYDPEFLHQIMQLSPIIHVDPDGKTAKGRWYGYGPIIMRMGEDVHESIHSGTYEMEYVKEGGVWKIKAFSWRVNYISRPGTGIAKAERFTAIDPNFEPKGSGPDVVAKGKSTAYPAGYIYPFHYKHPVTGKETSEDKINSQLGFNIGQ